MTNRVSCSTVHAKCNRNQFSLSRSENNEDTRKPPDATQQGPYNRTSPRFADLNSSLRLAEPELGKDTRKPLDVSQQGPYNRTPLDLTELYALPKLNLNRLKILTIF